MRTASGRSCVVQFRAEGAERCAMEALTASARGGAEHGGEISPPDHQRLWVVDGEERCTGATISTPRVVDPAVSGKSGC